MYFVFTGNRIRDVDLTASPRVVTSDLPFSISDSDGALCSADGIKVFKGPQYYQYESALIMAISRLIPVPKNITREMMGCQD